MAPGLVELPPTKKVRLTPVANPFTDDMEAGATALPTHPLGVKPAGNAYSCPVSENLKSRCGAFALLPDELLSHILESFDCDTLIRLGSTCKALYAFTRLDELWRALFIA
jgi:hypothetical protein